VTARDILAQVELASGLGLIRDAVTIANDASASLSQKVALFGASAVMTPQDRARLDGLLTAVERRQRRREPTPLQGPTAAATSTEMGSVGEVATSDGPFVPSGNHHNGSRSRS
jgi:hypothetical protein